MWATAFIGRAACRFSIRLKSAAASADAKPAAVPDHNTRRAKPTPQAPPMPRMIFPVPAQAGHFAP